MGLVEPDQSVLAVGIDGPELLVQPHDSDAPETG
jgi:hypothetical protein